MTRVVCLHGLRRTPSDWDGVRAGFPAAWHVCAPQLPADPARALAVADAAIEDGDIVVGHSMGAVLARRVVAQRPRPLAAMVLTSSFFPPARNGRTRTATALDYLGHRVAFVRQARRRDGAARERSEGSPRALGLLIGQAIESQRHSAAADAIEVATLVVHTRDDHHVPVDFAIAAAARHPAWSLAVLERGGHHVHVVHPATWLAHVLPWLTAPRPAASPR